MYLFTDLCVCFKHLNMVRHVQVSEKEGDVMSQIMSLSDFAHTTIYNLAGGQMTEEPFKVVLNS